MKLSKRVKVENRNCCLLSISLISMEGRSIDNDTRYQNELTSVGSLVRLQVGALRVHLVAACHVASVNFAPFQCVAAFAIDR